MKKYLIQIFYISFMALVSETGNIGEVMKKLIIILIKSFQAKFIIEFRPGADIALKRFYLILMLASTYCDLIIQ